MARHDEYCQAGNPHYSGGPCSPSCGLDALRETAKGLSVFRCNGTPFQDDPSRTVEAHEYIAREGDGSIQLGCPFCARIEEDALREKAASAISQEELDAIREVSVELQESNLALRQPNEELLEGLSGLCWLIEEGVLVMVGDRPSDVPPVLAEKLGQFGRLRTRLLARAREERQ